MTKGCLLFAHNGVIDYGSQAVLAARLAIKHLGVPVSLVTDQETLDSIRLPLPFDKVILTSKPDTTNWRYLSNGASSEIVEFINSNRSSAYDLTPYDRTLLIDTDFLIMSDTLNKYWDDADDFLITDRMVDLTYLGQDQTDYVISSYSINMLWATNIMFTKNDRTRLIFDLVDYIKDNYLYYSQLYDFPVTQYRNDFAFSIACHMLGAYGTLPSPIFIRDVDSLIKVDQDRLLFMLKDYNKQDNYLLLRTQRQDIHLMNKRNLLDNFDALMELAND